jgi:hypothetical protein
MKGHYKGEFGMASLLKQNTQIDKEDEDEEAENGQKD